MKKILLLAAVLLICLSWADAKIRVLESSPSGMVVEFTLDDYRLDQEGDFIALTGSNMASLAIPGSPDLPYAELKMGIPPGAGINATILSSSKVKQTLSHPLRPIPNMEERDGMSYSNYQINEASYRELKWQGLQVLPETTFRGYSFIPVAIYPFAYDGNLGLEITNSAIISLTISGNVAYRSQADSDPLSGIILDQLVNKEFARNWQSFMRPAINYVDFSRSDWWVRVETDQDGLFKISPAQLSALPLADVDPRSFRIFSTNGAVRPSDVLQEGAVLEEIPIKVYGESDGVFSGADYILFYGSDRDGQAKNLAIDSLRYYNPYSKNTVYWLTFGGDFPGSPKRINKIDSPSTWTQETSSYQTVKRVDEERYRRETIGFDWFMTRMFGSQTADYDFQVELSGVDASKPQYLKLSIVQEDISSYLTHRMSVFINGAGLGGNVEPTEFVWGSTTTYNFNQQVTGFVNGSNTIRIRINRLDTANYFFDYYEVGYYSTIVKGNSQLAMSVLPEALLQNVRYNISGNTTELAAFQINSFTNVVELSVANNAVVSSGTSGTPIILSKPGELFSPAVVSLYEPYDLVANMSPTDNVIIAPAEFIQQAETLAGLYNQSLGIRSIVVNQQHIFDQFNGGHPDPIALRQYLRYLYQHFSAPKLSSLTLFGLGSIDWVNTSGQAAVRNKVILFQKGKDVSDDWFGMLTNNTFPEIAIGRYPVRTVAEAEIMVSNYQHYALNPDPGWWQNSMVFLADDLYNGPNSPYESIHTVDMEGASNLMNRSVLIDKIFAWDYPYDEFQNKPGACDDMFKSLNDGRLIFYYIGHGSYDKLGAEDYMNGSTDMVRYTNVGKQSFFIAASCKVANFDYWGFDSLAQKVVLKPQTASIASWAATRISYPTQNNVLMTMLLDRMVNQRIPVGNAILSTKIAYTQDPFNESVYVLLGDPLLKIYPPERDNSMTVAALGAEKTSLRSREQVEVRGAFSKAGLAGEAELVVFDTDRKHRLDSVNLSHRGSKIFRGKVSVDQSTFKGGFIVPDDVTNGDSGMAVAYIWDAPNKKAYTSYNSPISLSDEAVQTVNAEPPNIEIYLGSLDFRAGDTVGSSPSLIARISDDNGINITGSSGHNILLVVDNSLQPISVTEYFSYNVDSWQAGTLVYQLPELRDGSHTIQLIAFDGFNLPAVKSTTFLVKKSGELSLERFLIYPNPMQKETSLTFILSEDTELSIGIYSITGKRLRQIKTSGRQGFNAIKWNGRDEGGKRIANNTYFVKIKATNSAGKSIEKTERLVIYN